jgi:hypothetical protein
MSAYTGGCACGAVRYAYTAEPQFSFHCCCRQCQRVSGSGHTSLFIAAAESFRSTGELSSFDRGSGSGNTVTNHFCPWCGSPVMSSNSGYPNVRYVHAATLDELSRFVPEKIVWGAERQAWDHLDPKLE